MPNHWWTLHFDLKYWVEEANSTSLWRLLHVSAPRKANEFCQATLHTWSEQVQRAIAIVLEEKLAFNEPVMYNIWLLFNISII